MFTTGDTVGVAEWIVDDTSFYIIFFFPESCEVIYPPTQLQFFFFVTVQMPKLYFVVPHGL